MIVDGLLECSKPVISAVQGFAMGLGATVALLCDIVVAEQSATFADTHVNLGIGAGDGGQVIWPLLMGVNRAKYYLMTGDRLPAPEAERLGLVNFVTEDGGALDPGAGDRRPLGRRPRRCHQRLEGSDQHVDSLPIRSDPAAVAADGGVEHAHRRRP